MALLANFVLGSGFLAAFVIALLAGFHGGFAAGLLVFGASDAHGGQQRSSGDGEGQGLNELHIFILY